MRGEAAMMRGLLLLVCFWGGSLFASTRPFEDYQTIIDRQMFGAPPHGFDPSKMPSDVAKANSKAEQERSKAEEKIKRAIRFSVLNVTADGEIMVGFTDQRDAKNPLNYYLKVGETRNGWTVKEADRNEATMTIVDSEGIEVTLRLGGDSASDPNSVRNAVANKAATDDNAVARPTTLRLRSLRGRRAEQEREREAQEREREARDEERSRELATMRAELQSLSSGIRAAATAQMQAQKAAEAQAAAAARAETDEMEPPPGPPPPDDAMDAGDGPDGH